MGEYENSVLSFFSVIVFFFPSTSTGIPQRCDFTMFHVHAGDASTKLKSTWCFLHLHAHSAQRRTCELAIYTSPTIRLLNGRISKFHVPAPICGRKHIDHIRVVLLIFLPFHHVIVVSVVINL